jgi:hypothetical protein
MANDPSLVGVVRAAHSVIYMYQSKVPEYIIRKYLYIMFVLYQDITVSRMLAYSKASSVWKWAMVLCQQLVQECTLKFLVILLYRGVILENRHYASAPTKGGISKTAKWPSSQPRVLLVCFVSFYVLCLLSRSDFIEMVNYLLQIIILWRLLSLIVLWWNV